MRCDVNQNDALIQMCNTTVSFKYMYLKLTVVLHIMYMY